MNLPPSSTIEQFEYPCETLVRPFGSSGTPVRDLRPRHRADLGTGPRAGRPSRSIRPAPAAYLPRYAERVRQPTQTTDADPSDGFLAEIKDAVTTRAALLVLGVLALQLAFVTSCGAFHHPKPSEIPIAVPPSPRSPNGPRSSSPACPARPDRPAAGRLRRRSRALASPRRGGRRGRKGGAGRGRPGAADCRMTRPPSRSSRTHPAPTRQRTAAEHRGARRAPSRAARSPRRIPGGRTGEHRQLRSTLRAEPDDRARTIGRAGQKRGPGPLRAPGRDRPALGAARPAGRAERPGGAGPTRRGPHPVPGAAPSTGARPGTGAGALEQGPARRRPRSSPAREHEGHRAAHRAGPAPCPQPAPRPARSGHSSPAAAPFAPTPTAPDSNSRRSSPTTALPLTVSSAAPDSRSRARLSASPS